MTRSFILAAGLAAAITSAHAGQQTLKINALVFSTVDKLSIGFTLIRAAVKEPAAYVPLLACALPGAGAQVVRLGRAGPIDEIAAGFEIAEIIVTSGPAAGCRGFIPAKFLSE